MGPGIDLGLPVFNRNQGGRARAEAQLRQASAAYAAVQQRVGHEIREAAALFDQAQTSLTAWRETIVDAARGQRGGRGTLVPGG